MIPFWKHIENENNICKFAFHILIYFADKEIKLHFVGKNLL